MDPNIIIRQSNQPVKQTIDKLEAFLRGQGITIYARIDQQAGYIGSRYGLSEDLSGLIDIDPLMAKVLSTDK